jgi:hypothetical protein
MSCVRTLGAAIGLSSCAAASMKPSECGSPRAGRCAKPSVNADAVPPSAKPITDSLVEDDAEKSTGDIFETDFELPAVGDDSASQVVAIDSDTDLELNEDVVVDEENPDYEVTIDEDEAPVEEESASQVMIMDDDEGVVAEEEENAFAMDGDGYTPEEGSAADELAGVHHEGEEDTIPIRTVVAQPAKWGVVPTLFLVPSLLVLVVGGLMCLEVVRGMWGYQQPVRTNDSLLRGVAGAFDVKVAD